MDDGRAWLGAILVGIVAAGAAARRLGVNGAGAGSKVRVGPRLRGTMITVTNDSGRPFVVRVVRQGDRYGLNDVLTYPNPKSAYEMKQAAAGDVLVEFYDASHVGDKFGPRGQFVSRYYLSSLAADQHRSLSLHGGVQEWILSQANVVEAVAFAASFVSVEPRSGSSVRVGPRLRVPAEAEPDGDWVPFGRSPVVTGMRVKISEGSGLDSGRIGVVTSSRTSRFRSEGTGYGVDFLEGGVIGGSFTWPKIRLLKFRPKVAPLVDRSVKLARVRLVHKISQSDKDTVILAVALGDLDDIDTIKLWLKGNGRDVGLGRGMKWRQEPDGKIVLFPSRDSSWHSVIVEPLPEPIGSGNRASTVPKATLRHLEQLRSAMEEAFSCGTAFGDCKADRPSSGHCMLAAMVVQDLLGGCILHAEVDAVPHYWNQADGLEIDLTGDQFGKSAVRACLNAKDASLYPGPVTVFPRQPGKSLVPSLNATLLERHRVFVDALVPAMRRQGLDLEAVRIQKIVDEWPVLTRPEPDITRSGGSRRMVRSGSVVGGSRVRVGPRLRPVPSSRVDLGEGRLLLTGDLTRDGSPFGEGVVIDEGKLTIGEQGDLLEGRELPTLLSARYRRAASKGSDSLYWKLQKGGREMEQLYLTSPDPALGVRIRLRRGNHSFDGSFSNHVFPWVRVTPTLIEVPHIRTGKRYILLDKRGDWWIGDADTAQIVEFVAS